MSWVKLDDQFPDHPKVVAAGEDAAWLHVCALCYCAEHLTDGFVPTNKVARLTARAKPALARRLVDVELWSNVEGGYEIHDYLKYNPSRATVLAEREAGAERQRKSRDSRKGSQVQSQRDNDRDTADGHGVSTADPSPSPSPKEFSSRPLFLQQGDPQPVDDDEFWEAVWRCVTERKVTANPPKKGGNGYARTIRANCPRDHQAEANDLLERWDLSAYQLARVLAGERSILSTARPILKAVGDG